MGRRISGRFRRSLFPQSSFQRSLLFSLCSLYRMVMVGTKWEESARVEMLFSWCCRWFFPITRPAVHELERNVTTAEHTATMRYLMNAFMFWLINILPPFSFVSRRRFPEKISSLSGKFPFGFILFRRFSGKRFEGLVAGLGVWFDEFWFEFSFPVREKYFPS